MNMNITIRNADVAQVAEVLRELASLLLAEPNLVDDLEWLDANGTVVVRAEFI